MTMFQVIYHNTGLTPDDVIDAKTGGNLEMFCVRPRKDGVHVMLYPNRYPDVKIQILRYSANVWCGSSDQLPQIEDLLNKIFGNRSKKHFKNSNIILCVKELRNIHETLLGQLSALIYYNSAEIAAAVSETLRSFDFNLHPSSVPAGKGHKRRASLKRTAMGYLDFPNSKTTVRQNDPPERTRVKPKTSRAP